MAAASYVIGFLGGQHAYGILIRLIVVLDVFFFFFFFKQKTAYEVGTGDWSSDVCLRSHILLSFSRCITSECFVPLTTSSALMGRLYHRVNPGSALIISRAAATFVCGPLSLSLVPPLLSTKLAVMP